MAVTDYGSREGVKADRIQLHHGADTSLAVMIELQEPGGRLVSSNYIVKDDVLWASVPEQYRAFTSGSGVDDRRAITYEIANESTDGWTVSDRTMHTVAKSMADVARRYGFPLNDDTVITHQEIYLRFGRSYATACPGDLQRRKGELIALANQYLAGGSQDQAAESAAVAAETAKRKRRKAEGSMYISWDARPQIVYEVYRDAGSGERKMKALTLQDGAFANQGGLVIQAQKPYVDQLAKDLGYGAPIESVSDLIARVGGGDPAELVAKVTADAAAALAERLKG